MSRPVYRTMFELQTAYGWGPSHLGGKGATERLLQWLNITPTCAVLDVGCGSGDSAFRIADRFGCRVIGVDSSRYEIAVAQDRCRRYGLASRVHFIVADARHMPFRNGAFDRLLVQSVLAFLPTPDGGCDEFRRVLKPNGRLALNEISSGPGLPPQPATTRLIMAGHEYRLRSPKCWRTMFERAAFRITAISEQPGRRRSVAGIAWWIHYTASRVGRLLVRNATSPRNWKDGLLFVDLFRIFALREPPYLLLVALTEAAEPLAQMGRRN
jgi:SAM-dependent methyltransferase